MPDHLREVSTRREVHVFKTMQQVKDRLTREIAYWDHRANELREKEAAGKNRSSLNSSNAQQRADALAERLKKRMADLELERRVIARPPAVLGGCLVVPAGFFRRAEAVEEGGSPFGTRDREIERVAMEKVMETERRLGCIPRDVSAENRGYDIESRDPQTGKLRFLEVKGRQEDANTVTITKNEILTALNQPEAYRLCIVLVSTAGERSTPLRSQAVHAGA